jgi:hypothetical protein
MRVFRESMVAFPHPAFGHLLPEGEGFSTWPSL